MLVGGADLGFVGAGPTVYRPVRGLQAPGLEVTKLATGPGADYAFVQPRCSGYLWVYRIAAGVARRLATTADDLLGSAYHAWAVTYRDSRVVLTPLAGGRTVTLRARTDPVADTASGLVVQAYGRRPASPPTLELMNPSSGELVRRLATGSAVGAAGDTALVSLPDCRAPANGSCTLETLDLTTGRPAGTFHLPTGRVPVSDAVFGPSARQAAFLLARAAPHRHHAAGRLLSPANIAVLNLRTGRLAIVPGFELPPRTQAGLAFDPSGRWLLATVSQGDRGELLAWQQGMAGPAVVTSLPGPLEGAPPLVPAAGR